MEDIRIYNDGMIRSRFSLKPLVDTLKKTVTEGKAGGKKLYGDLLEQFDAIPELLQPQEDTSLLKQHHELMEMLLTTVFPPAPSEPG